MTLTKVRTQIGVLAAALGLAFVGAASATAAAAPQTAARHADTSATAASLSVCTKHFTDGPADAVYACGTQVWIFQWPNGHYEVSLVGTDGAAWDSWQLSDGTYSAWTSMGGHDLIWGMELGYADGSSGSNLVTMRAVGSDDHYWCRTYVSGWGNWYDCNNTTFRTSGRAL
ncbi:hypothetical protein ACFO3J_33465 [Streptomyces polygonati]|uniref:Secreted protein n=1 Tax=Streptomyces polygonati TaxID=1617087 RepID=A0ABV8HZ38_9ACTN